MAQISKPGGGFQIVEREIPEPGAGQVRVKVNVCGVCHRDALVVEGSWPGISYPRAPGHEIAGVVDAVGAGVSEWKKVSESPSVGTGETTSPVQSAGASLGVAPVQLISGRKALQGWASGTAADGEDTLRFCELSGVRPMTETFPLEEADAAYARMDEREGAFSRRSDNVTGLYKRRTARRSESPAEALNFTFSASSFDGWSSRK